MNEDAVNLAADALASSSNSDVLIFNGEVSQGSCKNFIDAVCKRNRRDNVILILVTPGGDPDAAYKIGRSLQEKYKQVSIYIPGWCKSAGTLISLAANIIYIGDRGELGPLDIQIAKSDEIAEMGSGLTVDAAMKSLEATAVKMFFNLLISIRRDTQGMITTRTASELSSSMVVKLLDPIYRQIDPMKIGENSRAMNITKSYGGRLASKSKILKNPKSLDFLISSYPDHGFVIDREEASALFSVVLEPTAEMSVVSDALDVYALEPQNRPGDGSAFIKYLSAEYQSEQRTQHQDDTSDADLPAQEVRPSKRKSNGESTISTGDGA